MRYQVLRPLESGPNVCVYLVADRWEARLRKILTLLPVDVSDESERLELENLFIFRQSLDHPLLVRVDDLAFRGKRIGFVSEFVDACPLPKKLRAGLAWNERRFLALQLAELLAYLHRKRFFCGFVKPSQLFVLSGNRLMANFLVPEGRYGTEADESDWIRYAAPEFLSMRSVTAQTDLYSLGMVFYHLFTGHEPYAEQDLESLKRKQLVALPVRPRKLNPDIPGEIEQLIQDLIQKDPRVRPTSIEYVAAVIKEGCDSKLNALPRFRSVLLGRDVESATFRKLYERHLTSPATRFIAIGGASGIGKTSLMARFETIAKIRRAETYTVSHHRGSGIFEAFTELLRKVVDKPESTFQVGKVGAAHRTKTVHPETFLEDFIQLLGRISKRQPIVLCANDLQWMDEGSLEVYKRILNRTDLRILVIGNYRTDELPQHWEELKSELSRRQVLTELTLHPLRGGEARGLVTNLLGDAPSEELYKRVVSQCAGNPFYIYEFLRFLQETGELSFRSGHWQWQPKLDEPKIPGTVIDSILSRLRGIDQLSARILECLSVLERPIRMDWLAQILKMNMIDLEEKASFLGRLDFLSVSGTLDQPAVSLSHDWLGLVVRNNLAPGKRRIIHKEIATIFETAYLKAKDPVLGGGACPPFLASERSFQN
ncbi:AAA family ATPase [Acidobacteria bacterium AH-259-O06]|nr:AAA family ATPase [Acidobacteria bacterium AH-259-O06]